MNNKQEFEDIVVVPKQWTKNAYEILVKHNVVPRPWHLEGRWGSRTHRIDDSHMGLPIISAEVFYQQASLSSSKGETALSDLLTVKGGTILKNQPFVKTKRARDPEYFDATTHPEKCPAQWTKKNTQQQSPLSPIFPRPRNRTPLFTYCELFAGIGGFGVALEALGGTCIFCSELEEHCRETYMANFDTPKEHIHGDIYQVKDEDFPLPGTLDLLVGGFPCQPFSRLSTQPGLECETGRGLLFLQIIRALKLSQPKGFLLENVPGLFDMTETYQHILKSFTASGYYVTAEVCSSRGLTATMRKRLYFVGIRNDLVDNAVDGAPSSFFDFPFIPDLQLKAEHILDYDDLPESELDILRLVEGTMNQLLKGGRWRPHNLAWPNRPCNVLTSHYGNAVGRGESQLVPCHAPHNPRRFSIREVARIMGFPNSFQVTPPKFKNRITSSTTPEAIWQSEMAYRKLHYRMFGNAVCPPVIAALAGAVLERCNIALDDEEKNSDNDWTRKGLDTGIALALAATKPLPCNLPRGCLVPND